MDEKCPVCGQAVEVYTADEGTSSYVPREAEMLRRALRRACEGWMEGSIPLVRIANAYNRDYESWRELADDLKAEARKELAKEENDDAN